MKTVVLILTFVGCVVSAPVLEAAESDLSVSLEGPSAAAPGDSPLITVNYANAGPDTPGSTVVDVYIPTGLPMPMSEYTQQAFDALQESAATFDGGGNVLTTTDTLGNTPFLFIETNYCEHLKFQLQGPSPDYDYIAGLDAGVDGSFTFNPQFPVDDLRIGMVTITEPAFLQQVFLPASTSSQVLEAANHDRYSRGGCLAEAPEDCSDLSYCFGRRVSEGDLIEAPLELVNDGSADPTLGCGSLQGFTPGNIALLERGTCEFGDKVVNAENAGAVAVFMVNDGRCGGPVLDPNPDSPLCVINMNGGLLGDLATIPVIQVSVTDGTPIIDAVSGGTPVQVRIGPESSGAHFDAEAWLHQSADEDPVDENNTGNHFINDHNLFVDGFESGHTSFWGNTSL